MNFQKHYRQDDERAKWACETLNKEWPDVWNGMLCPQDLDYYAWPQTYGSTAGPFGGIGGQAMSTFTLEAFENMGYAVVFCGPKVVRVTDSFQFLGCECGDLRRSTPIVQKRKV